MPSPTAICWMELLVISIEDFGGVVEPIKIVFPSTLPSSSWGQRSTTDSKLEERLSSLSWRRMPCQGGTGRDWNGYRSQTTSFRPAETPKRVPLTCSKCCAAAGTTNEAQQIITRSAGRTCNLEFFLTIPFFSSSLWGFKFPANKVIIGQSFIPTVPKVYCRVSMASAVIRQGEPT